MSVVSQAGSGSQNVRVSVDGTVVGIPGTNGTVEFTRANVTDSDDLTITLDGPGFKASLDYHITDNSTLVLMEESYEYDRSVGDDD